jgi:hypothetical protein
MRTLRAVLCAATVALGLSSCGSGEGEGQLPETTTASDARLFGDCHADDPALERSRVVWEVDLDGDGTANEIAYVPRVAGGPCADSFFTTIHGGAFGMSLSGMGLDPASVEVLQLRGTDRQLLLGRGGFHPRGGFEPHLFGYGADGLGEILTDGEPVVGFVATDGGAAPAGATCTDEGGLATLTAKVHQPPGVVLAWDVTRTTYELRGNAAEQVAMELVREAVADPVLREQAPDLFDPESWFRDCIAEEQGGQSMSSGRIGRGIATTSEWSAHSSLPSRASGSSSVNSG